MHPAFLNQLFAQLNLQSPQLASRPPSVPYHTATPDIIHTPTPLIPQKVIATDVDNFLNTLEPSLSSNGDSRKRRLAPEPDFNPPKRRAFGLAPPRELVIDISDDDDDVEESPKPRRPQVKIPDRQALTQQV
jgi:hypothetical protein